MASPRDNTAKLYPMILRFEEETFVGIDLLYQSFSYLPLNIFLYNRVMDRRIQIATTLANTLDNQFGIGKFRFGIAALIDLIPIPGVGDIIDTGLSLYIVLLAIELHVPTWVIIRMLMNIAINFIFGIIPIFGSIIYFIRKANVKNAALLKKYATQVATP